MNTYSPLEHIANGIYAANKIRNLRQPIFEQNSRTSVHPDNISMIRQILDIVHEYIPETHKKALEDTIDKSNLCNETYKSLKQHFTTIKTRGIDNDNLIQTLHIMKPVLNNNTQNLIEKMMKAYEIFNS